MQILLEASQVPGDKIIAEDKYNSSFANGYRRYIIHEYKSPSKLSRGDISIYLEAAIKLKGNHNGSPV